MTRRLITLGIVVAVLCAAALTALVLIGGPSSRVASFDIGGDFRLPSSKGGEVASADLKGKPYAVFFGFTHCPEVCPTTLYEMSGVLTRIGDDAKDFRVFFITVDPERDTVETMRDYIASFDPRMEALVPSLDQLPKLASDFRVYYKKVPTSDGAYTMDHTASVYLFDREGTFAGTISFGEAAELREAKVRRLLGTGT